MTDRNFILHTADDNPRSTISYIFVKLSSQLWLATTYYVTDIDKNGNILFSTYFHAYRSYFSQLESKFNRYLFSYKRWCEQIRNTMWIEPCDQRSRSNILRAHLSTTFANRILSFIARSTGSFPSAIRRRRRRKKLAVAKATDHKEQVGITVSTIYRWYLHERKHDANVWNRVRNLSPRLERKRQRKLVGRGKVLSRVRKILSRCYPRFVWIRSLLIVAFCIGNERFGDARCNMQ